MRNLLGVLLCAASFVACAPPTDVDEDGETAVETDDALLGTALRFDLATLDCGSTKVGEVCAPDDDKCLCRASFDKLNHSRESHFVVVGTDNLKTTIEAKGNQAAAYVDDMNTGADTLTGAARADALMKQLGQKFPSGVPKWILVNEISASRWPVDADYRAWVVAFARRIKVTYGRNLIVAAPFSNPGHHGDAWGALAKYAYVAGELYLTGADINKSGNSVAYCRDRYASSIAAYASLGVPLSRLMIMEHFGSTTKDTNYGRAGVSAAGWKNAIEARGEAARQLGFAGYLSYSWSTNKLHETQAVRLGYIDTYVKTEVLP